MAKKIFIYIFMEISFEEESDRQESENSSKLEKEFEKQYPLDNNNDSDETKGDIMTEALFIHPVEKNEDSNSSKLPEMQMEIEEENRKNESSLPKIIEDLVNASQKEEESARPNKLKNYKEVTILKLIDMSDNEKKEIQINQQLNKKRKFENKNGETTHKSFNYLKKLMN